MGYCLALLRRFFRFLRVVLLGPDKGSVAGAQGKIVKLLEITGYRPAHRLESARIEAVWLLRDPVAGLLKGNP